MMKIVFFGNADRGLVCLQAMCEKGFKPDLVVVHPGDMTRNTVAQFALTQAIPVIAPEQINASEAVDTLSACSPDLIVMAGYSQIIKKPVLDIPRIGCLNLHGGKLPAYRGSSPINWMILRGETEGGISIIFADEGIDTGDILLEKRFPILPEDTARTIKEKTLQWFPEMLVQVLKDIASGHAIPQKQSEIDACYYPLRQPQDGLILWDRQTALEVHNQIRALVRPYPGAFSFFCGKQIFIWASALLDDTICGMPGRIHFRRSEGVVVMCQDRGLLIKTIQVTNESVMPASAYFLKTGLDFSTARSVVFERERSVCDSLS